ncbi:DUF3298 and DUF4163 domain-containing protein [Salegentibacter chungangensis]|uniref:DUF3298 domain-containing protein n=1 Tax=Salegentibacter chungangensis TaxID=1335724 RepID=A0ABW3NM49_9FLAO
MKKIIAIFVLAVMFAACEEEEKTIEFQQYSVERSFEDCNPENGDCTFISLTYPLIATEADQAEKINSKIEQHIIEIVDFQDGDSITSPEEMAGIFIASYAENLEEFPEYALPWEAVIFGEVSLKTASLISVKFDSQLFTGGAHGYGSISFLNFDPNTGKTFSQKQLFTAEFRSFMEKEFRKRQEIPADVPINSTGMFFEEDEFQLPANIGFTEDKLVLHYNPYEIAAYSEGTLKFEFPYSEVKDFLKINLKAE